MSDAIAVVVPVFDERVRFPEYGKLLADFIAEQSPGSELVFVDDGSADDTAELVKELAAAHPSGRVRLLSRPHEGKGAAVAAGIAETTTDYVGFCDLDLSTPLDEFARVIEAARQSTALAIGSRDVTGSTFAQRESRIRETLGRAYNRLLQATVTPGVVDTQCGAKAASRLVWDRILPFCRQRGFAWDAEIVAVAIALGITVQEIPIDWRHDSRSKINVGRDGMQMVIETRRIWASARNARATTARMHARPAATPTVTATAAAGVFEGQHAEDLIEAGRSHWWFRGKAALVATALRRTETLHPSGMLVDIGAGSGGVTAMLGWDPNRVLVVEGGAALAANAHRVHGLPAVQGAVAPLALASRSADVVCLLDVIEHLADPLPALHEARRVLRSSGRLVVNVPAHAWLWSSADEHLGHYRRYSERLLRHQLEASGFEPVLLSHVFSWLVPFVWAERRLRRSGNPELGLDRTSFLIDRTAMVLTAIERELLGRLPLPLGTSLLCVARVAP